MFVLFSEFAQFERHDMSVKWPIEEPRGYLRLTENKSERGWDENPRTVKRPTAVNTQISTLVTPPTPSPHYASLVYNRPYRHPSSAV